MNDRLDNPDKIQLAIRKLHTAISHAEEAINELARSPNEVARYHESIKAAVNTLSNSLGQLEAMKEARDREDRWQQSQNEFNRKYGALVERLAKPSDGKS